MVIDFDERELDLARGELRPAGGLRHVETPVLPRAPALRGHLDAGRLGEQAAPATPNGALTRRELLLRALAVAPAALVGRTTLPATRSARGAAHAAAPLKIVCVGGHPDDPESGCGGTLARYSAAGHRVKIVYLTRGERGIDGKSLDEAAHIRTLEAEAACVVLGATPLFFGQVDGATEATRAAVVAMTKLLMAEKPDVVFTHWPVDTHMDHQVASLLTMRACMTLRSARLFFFEVNTGSQTSAFRPNVWVDISGVVEKKKAALLAHPSQDGAGIWRMHHEPIAQWRGRELGVLMAEGFVQYNRGERAETMPGLTPP